MPDPALSARQKAIEKVNIACGAEAVTLRKPDGAYFDIPPSRARDLLESVRLRAEDGSWRAEVFSALPTDGDEPFAEYYIRAGFEGFSREAFPLGISDRGKPVMHIKNTYTDQGTEYAAHFVGIELEDTEQVRFLGFKIYMIDRTLSEKKLAHIFKSLFFTER